MTPLDYVHAAGWIAVGSWLATFTGVSIWIWRGTRGRTDR